MHRAVHRNTIRVYPPVEGPSTKSCVAVLRKFKAFQFHVRAQEAPHPAIFPDKLSRNVSPISLFDMTFQDLPFPPPQQAEEREEKEDLLLNTQPSNQ